ncbi:unnamed protein product [Lathyrus sativus]|nr:unnamed protein product [Lathyrus sativus]
MASSGYAYSSVSTYSTTRTGSPDAAVMKPFAPFVPKSNGSYSSEGAVTKKIIVPVTSRPYDQPAAEKYASSGDEPDDELHHQSNYKQGRKPIGTGSIRSASRDGYTKGYGGDKEGRRPLESNIKNGNYEYDSPNRYGGDRGDRGDRGAPVIRGGNIQKGYYDNSNGYGGDYKEGHKPIGGGNIQKGYYDSPNGYGGDYKEGHKPIGGGNIQKGYYDSPNGYGGDYKEGHKSIGRGSIQKGYYDSSNGYGGDYKEEHKPIGGGNIQKGYYNSPNGYGNYGNNYGNRPKISSDWSEAPRKGIQLSEPTHDIDKAMEVLRIEAAKRNHHYESNNDHHHYYDSPGPTAKDNWGASASANGSPRFADRTGSAGIMRPHGNVNQPQSRQRSSPIHVTFVDDGRDYGDDDYQRKGDIGRYGDRGAVMDSREAERKFKGTRI